MLKLQGNEDTRRPPLICVEAKIIASNDCIVINELYQYINHFLLAD